MDFGFESQVECCKKHCRLSEDGKVILRKKLLEMRDSLLADTVIGYCVVDIVLEFPLSGVNMIIENASEVSRKFSWSIIHVYCI